MINIDGRTQRAAALRSLAEELVKKKASLPQDAIDGQTPEEIRMTFHELSVHQVELEMQNEELRRVQAELDTERARYFDLYDLAPVGYCTLSRKGLIVEANLTAATMLGVPRDALINTPFSQCIAVADQNTFYLHQKKNAGNGPQMCELRMVRHDGTPFWAHLATTAVRDNHDRLECRLVISDITARKQTEEALHESEARYHRIVETAREGIWAFDAHWKTTYINPKMAELLGYELKDLLEKPFDACIFAADKADHVQRVQQQEQGKNETYERRLRHKEGHEIWFLISATAQLDAHGQFIGSFAMLTDITKRKQAEETLQRSEQRANEANNLLKLVLDTIPVRLFWKDLASTFLGCNHLFAQDAGFQVPEELIGLNDFSMGWREQAELYRQDDLEVMTSGKPKLHYEEIQTTPDGQQIWLSTSKVPLRDTQGEIIGVLGSYEDITQRKLAEEELSKAQKIESLGLLAGGIAHDFNNILMVIMGNIAMAKALLSPTDTVYDRLTTAETAASKAHDLARRFLTFAKGGTPLKRSISVANLIKTYSRLTLSGTSSTCAYTLPGDLWSIDADEGQIGQALTNIFMNADQATPEGGTITVHGENMIISAEDNLPLNSGRYVKISIKDEGKGIPEQHLGKVFDPYFTTKKKGSGLGLTSAFSIVKKHEGLLTVDSSEGSGTTFTLLLPASSSPDSSATIAEHTVYSGSGKILVMDDDEMVLEVIGTMLERLGYHVNFACNGEQALEKYIQAQESGDPYDAVIMDLIIPIGMGGREAMELLHAIDPQARVIISSGYSNNSVMTDYASYGFCDVIVKPYRLSDLSKKLQQVIHGEQSKVQG
jgi:PAS domain S-box-containing protein